MDPPEPDPHRTTWVFPRLWLPPWRRRRVALIAGGAALVALAALSLAPVRHPLLRAAGWALVATDPVVPADVIVISVDADGAGVLEAADLIQAGIARRVAIFPDPPDAVDQEFLRRGLHYYNAAEVSAQQLQELGVTDVEVIPRPVAGTEDESEELAPWGLRRGFHKILFIASTDHTRRTRREFARAMRGSGVEVRVHGSRYSAFDPDTWWQSHGGIRTEMLEMQKLLLDILLHPLG